MGIHFRPVRVSVFLLGLCFSAVQFCGAEVNLRAGTMAHFTSVAEGVQTLTSKDEFIQRLSPFDRSARMKTDKAVTEEQFLEFIKANVVPWTDDDKRKVETAIDHVRPALDGLPLSLPKTVLFIKTTGVEEGRASYTRDTAIIVPANELAGSSALLEKAICHELFHILSRHNPVLREKLYGVIGFKKCPEVEFPADLIARRITNPDAPKNDHYIRLRVDGSDVLGVPILFSNSERYDPARGGEFFDYLQFKFLLRKEGSGTATPGGNGSEKPRLAGANEISGLTEQVGRNTEYIIHPEEILADNFALLVIGQRNVPSPEILQKIKAALSEK